MSGVRLQCDAPGCGRLFPESPEEGGFMVNAQRGTIRGRAAAEGWTVAQVETWEPGKDFCPVHRS